ncbi:hypothetical protein GLAREA_13087 [Glarea lozoyensis ATCC 20868]|uniref:Uncharacterized protein n=1 Tax=Glarea lozoyensis (strain ATCC 20868 / MF5171) TaxID=1116229 RepID=S3CYL2_GLAL2|nr:uncharacterized protein GLAREA_13087 [Glarea lozoyensis ATCC 20868]EPE30039.1 hypothetical protein GLAREA_13087 [Glarea lozoyensis ATCC 20868]
MATTVDPPSRKATSSPAGSQPLRRVLTLDENSRRSSPGSRFSPSTDVPSPASNRRRSSNFSVDSISEARRTFQSSTDDLLLPRPDASGKAQSHDSSAWHSAPLAFALLPAVGGMIFQNGSSVVTDIMLLGLAAVFLNWSVRLPWDWYHSAQSIRMNEEDDLHTYDEDSEDENGLSSSQTLEEVPEDEASEPISPPPRTTRPSQKRETATKELYRHEIFALLSCFVFPLLGAYLLHFLRSQLSRPSEGLVSNYNLTIFLMASELRPVSHLIKLVQSRTLHLQRVVNANPYSKVNGNSSYDLKGLLRRLEEVEARGPSSEPTANPEAQLTGKQSASLITDVRKTLQPDLDALNRAVRRYEKRATLQAFQTESRLVNLESRLTDAISLAAAAANNGQRNRGFTGIIIEWAATAVVLPIQASGAIASLPFKTAVAIINYGKSKIIGPPPDKARKPQNAKPSSNGRAVDMSRLTGRKKT